MTRQGRYKATRQEFEPGSRRKVLKNFLGIKHAKEMAQVETVALKQAEDVLFKQYAKEHSFTAEDICHIHKVWLGKIYEWAGKYRNIDLIKGIRFANALHLPLLMREFEQKFLKRYTPCLFNLPQQIIQALAEVHVELILIHPFRDGNGRIARLLATLMALQAGLPPLDFRWIGGTHKQAYFKAVRSGRDRDYKPMEKVFAKVVEATLLER